MPLQRGRPDAVVATRPPGRTEADLLLVLGVMTWIAIALTLDSGRAPIGGDIWTQRGLGLVTSGLLVLALARELPIVRAQVAVVVVFATVVEYTFSPWLEVYVYRFDNVPAYVPAGHGLVYLAALALGRSDLVQSRVRAWSAAVIVVGGAWAAGGLAFGDPPDVLGAMWYACLLGFLLLGPSRGLYLGAFVVVSYLEIVGTALGTWEWSTLDPTGLIPIGNPPSGAAGGYGWFDLAALLAAPYVLSAFSAVRRREPRHDVTDVAG